MGLLRVGRTGSWRIRLVLLQGFAEDNDLGIGVAQHLNVRDGPVGVGTGSAFEDLFLTTSENPESLSFEFFDVLVEGTGRAHSVAHGFQSQLTPILGILEETGNEFVFGFIAEVVVVRSEAQAFVTMSRSSLPDRMRRRNAGVFSATRRTRKGRVRERDESNCSETHFS